MDIIFVVIIAALLALLLVEPIGWRHHRTSGALAGWLFGLIVLLPLLLLVTLFVPPAGPVVFGFYWLAPLAVGLLLVFLIASTAPRRPRDVPPPEDAPLPDQVSREGGALLIFADVLFWLFIVGAIVLLIVGYAA